LVTDQKTEVETHSITEEVPNQHFDLDALKVVWKTYCDQLLRNGRNAMLGTLTLSQPELLENYCVKYQVHNESQLRELEMEKSELVGFLRKQLRNYSLEFRLEKTESTKSFRPFTAEEKMRAMEEKNPHVSVLRQKLGLQPE